MIIWAGIAPELNNFLALFNTLLLIEYLETVFSLAVTKDSQYLVSGSKDGVIKIWDMDDFKEWQSF